MFINYTHLMTTGAHGMELPTPPLFFLLTDCTYIDTLHVAVIYSYYFWGRCNFSP